ncbi:MAG TPA: ribose-5-phosphate isomerase RpiA [candidate division Zixibacteria bacterium]|jgi:ribose 5-phosphate isomerase A
MSHDKTELKQLAARHATAMVESGMTVGLGHGSTSLLAVRELAQYLKDGRLTRIVGIPCSKEIEAEARSLGIPLSTLEENPVIDITLDGADEVDPQLNLIKGGGGALLREKIAAQASRREVIMIDDSKMSDVLGTKWAVPVEVVPFGWRTQAQFVESLGAVVSVRMKGTEPFRTDHGNMILDCNFGPITDASALADRLCQRVGIVEHGLFLGLATTVIVAGPAGVRVLTP